MKEYDQETFTYRLNLMMRIRGLSGAQLAELSGISTPAISQWRTGKQGINVRALFKLCQALDVSADWLLGLSNKSK